MTCKIPEPLFEIGDIVETTDDYKINIAELNNSTKVNFATYMKGTVSNVEVNKTLKVKISKMNGRWVEEQTNEIENIWICITLDNDPDKQVNQMYCRKVVN